MVVPDDHVDDLVADLTDDDVADDPFKKKFRSVMELFRTHFSAVADQSLSKEQEGILRRAVRLAYLKYGITADPATHENTSPTMQDVLDILHALTDGDSPTEFIDLHEDADEERVRPEIEQLEMRFKEADEKYAYQLLLGLEAFQPGGENDNLNGRTNVELDNRLVVIDMSMFADTGQAPLFMHVMFDWIYQRAQSSDRRTQVTIDEAHYLVEAPGSVEWLKRTTRHSRHLNLSLHFVTQELADFYDTDGAETFVNQSSIKLLHRQGNLAPAHADALGLTDVQAAFVRDAVVGKDGLGFSTALLDVDEGGTYPLRVTALPEEEAIIEDDDRSDTTARESQTGRGAGAATDGGRSS